MDGARLNPPAESRTRRVLRAVAAALLFVLPATVLLGLLTTRISGESARVAAVLGGVEALRPVGALAAALADARAGAVTDGVDVEAVRAATADLDAAAAAPGGLPGGADRWADLRGRVLQAADRGASGPAAAQEYGTLGALTLALSAAVADAGGALDGGRAGTGYLTDLAGTTLPGLVTTSAEYVDALVAVQEVPEDEEAPDDPVLAGRYAAARERLAELAGRVERELGSGIDPGAGELDEALLARAGDFRAAAAALVPSAGFPAPDPGEVDRGRVRAQQGELVRTGAQLQRAILAELSVRAGERGAQLRTEAALAAAAGVLVLAVAGGLLWTGSAGPTRSAGGSEPPGPDGPGRDLVTVGPGGFRDEPEQLVRVGRAVRRRPAEQQEPARGPA